MDSKNFKKEPLVAYYFAFFSFLLHFFVNANGAYGFFRDELYYLACSEHLDLGYVDHPPLSIWILKLNILLLGDSLLSVRLIPALCIAGTIVMAGKICQEIGGTNVAITFCSFFVSVSGIHLVMGGFYSMNPIDIFIWSVAFYVIIKITKTRQQHYWILLGLVLGIGLLNKISVLFLGAGIAISLVFSQERMWLKTPWPYIAAAIAILLFTPYVFWNIHNDFAHLEFIRNASEGKYSGRTAFDFLKEVFIYHNPLNFPATLLGLWGFFFYKPLKKFQYFGWIFLTVFVILLINKTSKGEYLTPAYSILFAASGVFFEKNLNSRVGSFFKYSYCFPIGLVAIIGLPAGLPVLPVEDYIRYSEKIGLRNSSSEGKEMNELPQFFADMHGWEQKAQDVAKVFNTLSKEEKEKCAIFSTNYGRCGAIDHYGKALGLPPSIGNHNNYWIWGTRNCTGEILIILGGILEEHVDDFESCVLAGVSDCTYCMPYEDNLNIFLCRGLKTPIQNIWDEEKNYE